MTSIPKNRRPMIDLNSHKDLIIQLFNEEHTASQIAQHLQDTFSITVTDRTLRRRLRTWNIYKRQRTIDTPELRTRIRELFLKLCLDDKEMLQVLQAEGYEIGQTALARLRLQLGLPRRINSVGEER